jgi:hypothetical protein
MADDGLQPDPPYRGNKHAPAFGLATYKPNGMNAVASSEQPKQPYPANSLSGRGSPTKYPCTQSTPSSASLVAISVLST